MMVSIRKSILFGVLPLLNLIFWFKYSQYQATKLHFLQCQHGAILMQSIMEEKEGFELNSALGRCPPPQDIIERKERQQIPDCDKLFMQTDLEMDGILTEKVVAYKANNLAKIKYPPYNSIILNPNPQWGCSSYVNPHVSQKQDCFAAVMTDIPFALNGLRFNQNWKLQRRLNTDNMEPAGYFKKVGHEKSRMRLAEKMGPFLRNIDAIENHFKKVLKEWGKSPGDDIVLMVMNEGEMDLLINFACSCRTHNISMSHMMVVAAAENILPMIHATGAIGVYHESFAFAPEQASKEYLDHTFVDMMWYKAFAVWLLLKLDYNVLFQDVDLVWFKEPYPYFKDHLDKSVRGSTGQFNSSIGIANAGRYWSDGRKFGGSSAPDAYFSDDGQRGIRYTPFFANSGFYYVMASPRTVYFTWTIMTQFDILQISGSHQNVFTSRLIESMDLAGVKPKLLSMNEFPNGVKYHHDKPFMRAMQDKHEFPYNFHMCWTLNRDEKLKYFKASHMWYINEECSLDNVIKHGRMNDEIIAADRKGQIGRIEAQKKINDICCTRSNRSP